MALLPLFDIARGGLLAQEVGLTVVGNNIANVNTPGYSRERANLGQEIPTAYSGVLIGRGVRARNVERVVDPLIEKRLVQVTTDQGQQTARRDQLAALTGALSDLNEPSLSGMVDGFFDAVDALARNPAGTSERSTLLGEAGALADEVNRRAGEVAVLQRGVDDRAVLLVSQANDELERIADLNVAIANAELGGQHANQLRDEREAALRSLSGKLGVAFIESADGTARLSTANGAVLVEAGRVVHALAVQTAGIGLDGGALHEFGIEGPASSFIALPSAYARGEIAGLVSVRDGELVQASAQLDTFATSFASAVNAVQQNAAAVDLDGNPTAAVPFFSGTGASTFALAIGDPRRIAAARSTQPGDAANALALADVRSAPQAGLGNVTMTGYLSAMQARLGQQSALADDVATAAEMLTEQVGNERNAVSGVNLNEELANLLRFQHAFQAAAKLVNVADEVLTDLVNLVR